MVERPADVLRMDKSEPVKITGFGRFDATLRKTPGLGLFIFIALVGEWSRQGNTWLLGGFLLTVAIAVGEEYGPDILRRFTSRAPSGSSAPSGSRS